MNTREFKPTEWAAYFDSLSRTHRGTRASVETIDREVGVLANAVNLPFMGITVECAADGTPSIEVLLGGPNDANVTHVINDPSLVRVGEGDDPLAAVIQIESRSGTATLIYIGRGADALVPGFVSDELIQASRIARAGAATT